MREQDIQKRQRGYDRNREDNNDRDYGDRDYGDRDYGERERHFGGYRSLDEQRDYPSRNFRIERGQDIDRLSGPRGSNRRPEFGDMDRDGNYVGERSHYADRNAQWDDRRFTPGRGEHAGRGPRGYVRSDERIREEVCDALMRDSMLDASEMEVRVEGGQVTLDGTISDRNAKRRAEDITESISGVQDVTNKLKVKARTGFGQSDATTDAGHRNPKSERE